MAPNSRFSIGLLALKVLFTFAQIVYDYDAFMKKYRMLRIVSWVLFLYMFRGGSAVEVYTSLLLSSYLFYLIRVTSKRLTFTQSFVLTWSVWYYRKDIIDLLSVDNLRLYFGPTLFAIRDFLSLS